MIVVVSQRAGYQKEHHLLQYHPAGEEQLGIKGDLEQIYQPLPALPTFMYRT